MKFIIFNTELFPDCFNSFYGIDTSDSFKYKNIEINILTTLNAQKP